MMPRWKLFAMLGALVLCLPAFGEVPARPGAVNYVEGAAFIGQRQIHSRDVGSVTLKPGQLLRTEKGKAEILLTPGVFFRLDDHSAARMVVPDLNKTQIELVRGRAAVEVDQLFKQNDLEVVDGGVVTQLVKTGYYEFNADQPTAMVFKGKAAVEVAPDKYKVVKGGHEFALVDSVAGKPIAKEKPQKFDEDAAKDELYNWSSLRSQYLAEANNEMAPEYAGVEGFYPGWYWDPWDWDYTFIGGGPFWSPFGYGFYPPWYGGFYPGFGFYYGGDFDHDFHGGHLRRHGGHWPRAGGGFGHPITSQGFRHGGDDFGGFHGDRGFHGGGFGGGGFHGGGRPR